MPLESLKGKRPDVKRLVTERAEMQSEFFDPRMDISAENKSALIRKLLSIKEIIDDPTTPTSGKIAVQRGEKLRYLQLAVCWQSMFPTLDYALDADTLKKSYEDMFNFWGLEDNTEGKAITSFFGYALKGIEMNLTENSAFYIKMQKIIEEMKKRSKINDSLIQKAAYLKIIEPGTFNELNLGIDEWEKIKKLLESHIKMGNTREFIRSAAFAKILFPEYSRKFNISEDQWDSMKNYLNSLAKKDMFKYGTTAWMMSIISASKVDFTNQGLQLQMSPAKQIEPEATPTPKTKNY